MEWEGRSQPGLELLQNKKPCRRTLVARESGCLGRHSIETQWRRPLRRVDMGGRFIVLRRSGRKDSQGIQNTSIKRDSKACGAELLAKRNGEDIV